MIELVFSRSKGPLQVGYFECGFSLLRVGVELGTPRAQRRCRIIDGKLHEWDEGRPIILRLRDKGAEHVGDDSIYAFGLGIRIMMVWRPEDQSSAEDSMQSRPEFRSKAGIPIRDQDIGKAHVPKYGAHEVSGRSRRHCRAVSRDGPDAISKKVDLHLKEIMVKGRGRYVQEG